MNNTFKSNPSKLQNPEKQGYLKINSKKKLQFSNIEATLQKATFSMNKAIIIDFFKSDMKKLASLGLLNLIDEIDDIIYHSSSQFIQETKSIYQKKSKNQ
ncbi:hypothetical protein [Candidatus Protochlamydia sp. R18]|uniref:hypothetical protein n=1 Tax=Candidatus Protochlamydia sp. R18 TaxID=1353977 RepID=UPI0005A781F1|nr:hypothetical protein [Candidatus Protochlamydia sp. R18]